MMRSWIVEFGLSVIWIMTSSITTTTGIFKNTSFVHC